jgi:hypothetical protein
MPLLPRTESVPVLLEIFKGHKEELLAIEDSQVKVTRVVLGIFGTGGAFLASMVNKTSRITPNERWGLTLITSAILLLAMVSIPSTQSASRYAILAGALRVGARALRIGGIH